MRSIPRRLASSFLAATFATAPAPGQTAADASLAHGDPTPTGSVLAPLPQAIASFGACRAGSFVYVFGGHIGRAHQHTRDNVVGTFHRLDLDGDRTAWEALPDGPPLQGTALVAGPDGAVYRVGGMTAHNAPGEPDDLHSTASVQRYDPASGRWEDLPPLPEPRSSHDAIVAGTTLYVVGGWNLRGAAEPVWHETAWQADLAAETIEWRPLPAPEFPRRACALAAFGGSLAVLGGIDDTGPLAEVLVHDLGSATWRAAPDLPGWAFGCAAIGVDGALHATVRDGRLLRWNGADRWDPVASLALPRFFHRLVPGAAPRSLLAIGGAGVGGHLRNVESVPLPTGEASPHYVEWRLRAEGSPRLRQALLAEDERVYALGGNFGRDDLERFDPEQFSADLWCFDLGSLTAERLGEMPRATQSMATVSWSGARETHHLLLGGIGPENGEVGSLDEAWRFGADHAAHRVDARLPTPRTQCQLVEHEGKIYVLGGIDFDASGQTSGGAPLEVLVLDPTAPSPTFAASGITLPRARRSFGAAVLHDKVYLVGGLGDGFAAIDVCDVFDFATGEWSTLPQPRAWVSPQVVALDGGLYVACGGTMDGFRFEEDRSLQRWAPEQGWTISAAALPFAVRHVQMLRARDRLLLFDAYHGDPGTVVLRLLDPDPRRIAPPH